MSNQNPVVSVQKQKLYLDLKESGSIPTHSDYEDKAIDHLHRLLELDKTQCSDSTKEIIVEEAKTFRKRARYYWNQCKSDRKKVKDKPYFLEIIEVEVLIFSVLDVKFFFHMYLVMMSDTQISVLQFQVL